MSEKLKSPAITNKKLPKPPDVRVKPDQSEPPAYRPRTPLGERLWAIRQRIIASGEPLLSWEELERELAYPSELPLALEGKHRCAG